MSIEEVGAELDERLRAALEQLALVKEGRAKLTSLQSLLEQNRGELNQLLE